MFQYRDYFYIGFERLSIKKEQLSYFSLGYFSVLKNIIFSREMFTLIFLYLDFNVNHLNPDRYCFYIDFERLSIKNSLASNTTFIIFCHRYFLITKMRSFLLIFEYHNFLEDFCRGEIIFKILTPILTDLRLKTRFLSIKLRISYTYNFKRNEF